MRRPLPILQFVERPGVLDLGWGHPLPSLLPVEAWQAATEAALREFGWQALSYGHQAGPGPLIEWLADHLSRIEGGGAIGPRRFFVTAGASHALALVSTVLSDPGDIVLVDAPTYHFAFRILRDRGVRLVEAPTDADGIDPEALFALLESLRRQGHRVPLLYLVATFGNPTGRSLAGDRRHALIELAHRTGLTLVEDDTYRELVFQGRAPTSLWRLADGHGVIRIGSFAKTVAPGLRLGWINADPATVDTLADLGYVQSGGGVNHATALSMASFGASGDYNRHIEHLRDHYRQHRDALVDALRTEAPGLAVPSPAGGWFIWLQLPTGLTAEALLPVAEKLGVSFVPGTRFHPDGRNGREHLRLCYSLLPPARLRDAGRQLVAALRTLAQDVH